LEEAHEEAFVEQGELGHAEQVVLGTGEREERVMAVVRLGEDEVVEQLEGEVGRDIGGDERVHEGSPRRHKRRLQ
jgi:hypothetical protein